ncbi:MAG: polymer-forming cytoskeletal family protein [Nitrospirae bacterium]|nr:MAG: polymer-forming cytoskeletal family protein [Nitrospirota bacterium]
MWFKKPAIHGAEDSGTLVGKGLAVKGRCRFDGAVRIDGRLEGDIQAAGTLEVGAQGVLIGKVHVGTLVNRGTVKGTVVASELVQLLESSVLVGDIHTPRLVIVEGARLQGCCDRGAHDSDRELRVFEAEPLKTVTRALIGYEPSHAGEYGGRTDGGAQIVEEGMP